MYKLLIIDDDMMISNGIKNAIPWAQYGVEKVETAENAEKGEAIFLSFQPDLVLTDIRMPGMDGLELLKRIKKENQHTKVIILSGYDDFSYAQTALKLGAFDYVLKVADMEELLKVIRRAIIEIENERNEKEMVSKLKEQLKMSLPLLRYRYLNELVFGCIHQEQLIEKMEFIDIKLQSSYFLVGVIEIDDFTLLGSKIAEEERLLLKFRIINLIEEMIGGQGLCFETKYEEFVCIYYCKPDLTEEENKKSFINLCESINNQIFEKLSYSISVGIGNMGEGIFSIRACYEEAKRGLEHKLFTGKSSIIDIRDVEGYTSMSFKMDSETESKLISCLRVGDKKEVLKIIEVVFQNIDAQRNLGMGGFYKICIELLSIASRVLTEFDTGMEEICGKGFLYFEEVKKYKNLKDAKEWMILNFEKICNYILNTKILKSKKIVETAKNYIDERFTEEITLHKIAEFVHISPNYFSTLFSNEVGQSFLEYVTMRRIEKARKLLGEKDARVQDVGEKVGYDNPCYFSRIFKKYTGMSPLEYKERINTDN
ncbi:MAG: response regulator [Clostridia bacterium]|nr:response regulator [Clostridia bacterium]